MILHPRSRGWLQSNVHPDVLEMQPDAARWWHPTSEVSVLVGTAEYTDGSRACHFSVTGWARGAAGPRPATDDECKFALRAFGQNPDEYAETRTSDKHIARNFFKELKP